MIDIIENVLKVEKKGEKFRCSTSIIEDFDKEDLEALYRNISAQHEQMKKQKEQIDKDAEVQWKAFLSDVGHILHEDQKKEIRKCWQNMNTNAVESRMKVLADKVKVLSPFMVRKKIEDKEDERRGKKAAT